MIVNEKHKEIGKRISEARSKRGITQDEMAKNIALDLQMTNPKASYSGRQYQKIEAGEFPKTTINIPLCKTSTQLNC